MRLSSSIMSMVAMVAAAAVGGLAPSAEPAPAASAGFYLHDGDSVVMLGDSITDQCFYTMYVETYVTTRFPQLKIELDASRLERRYRPRRHQSPGPRCHPLSAHGPDRHAGDE